MNKNSICSIIVKTFQKNKVLINLREIKDIINKLDNYISLRQQPVPTTIIYDEWLKRNYDEITSYIINKNILTSINNFIKSYNKYYINDLQIRKELTNKKFLTMWIILAFPEFILDINYSIITKKEYIKVNNYKFDLYILAHELHRLLLLLENSNKEIMIKFNKHMNLFINALDFFLIVDKKEKVKTYIKQWIELEKTEQILLKSLNYNNDEINNQKYLIQENKKLIEKYINFFTKVTDDLFNKMVESATHQILIQDKLKQALEQVLYDNINNNIFDNIKDILLQIKNFILRFTKITEEIINEQIDIDYIIQLIKHDVLTINDIESFGYNILNNICSAGSIFLNNNKIEEWKNVINDNRDNHKLIMCKLMRLCLETINLIIDEIDCFKEYLLINK